MMPKFSIIIPVYNVAPYLHECLDSVLAQSFADWEAICVDDGSADGSGAILDEYAAKDSRFRVIHQANAGVSAARNVALDVAHGEWVWFVDGDDMIHPCSLAHISRRADSDGSVTQITICDTPSFETSYEEFANTPLKQTFRASNPNCIDTELYRRIRRGACATLLRRTSINHNRVPDLIMGEDVVFSFLIFWSNRKVLVLDARLYYYRFRAGSAVNATPTLRTARDLLDAELRCSQMLVDNSQYWTQESMGEYLKWNAEFCFWTFNWIFLRVSDSERTGLIPQWVQLQKVNGRLYAFTLERKMQMWIIKTFPWGWVARMVMVRWNGVKTRLQKVCRRVGAEKLS